MGHIGTRWTISGMHQACNGSKGCSRYFGAQRACGDPADDQKGTMGTTRRASALLSIWRLVPHVEKCVLVPFKMNAAATS